MENVTVLVNSCDLYESAWYPFFRLFQIQWPECTYPIVLNTETKIYSCDFMDVRSIPGGKSIPWSQRLINVLQQIETEYILYLLEDFFLMSPVSVAAFNEALELMQNDEMVGYIGLKHNNGYNFKEGFEDNAKKRFFSRDEVHSVNRVNSMSALWRKNWLLSLLKKHETPWEFEIYGSIRSRRTQYKVLQINNYVMPAVFDYEVHYKYGYGISQKKWLHGNKKLFEKYGIVVDFEELGCLDLNQSVGKQNNNECYSNGKGIRESLYNIKRCYRKTKKGL